MDDVVAVGFVSALGLEQMRDVLSARYPDMCWRMGESHYEGDYLKGRTPEQVAVRILHEASRYCAEIYFPLSEDAKPALPDADKRAFMQWLEAELLAAIKAMDIVPS